MAVAVPRGNRQAILINATRADFGGARRPVRLGSARGRDVRGRRRWPPAPPSMPVLFSAAADAPVAATLATVTGKPVDSKLDIPSEFTSTAELVLGQNNVPFWTRTVDSLAVAVTEEAPFTIDVVEPKVPIVRGGTMDLKVVAQRKPGFTAPIAVVAAVEPAGGLLEGGASVIPEGKDEAPILAERQQRRRADHLEDRRQRHLHRAPARPPPPGTAGPPRTGAGRLTVSSRLREADGRAAVPDAQVRAGERRAGQGRRPGREGQQGGRLPRRGEGDARRPAQQGDGRAGRRSRRTAPRSSST